MNERDHRHEIIENFDQYRIGLDDIFAFKCRSCGKCCRNREDILLNARDIYNIATALNLTHEEVIDKYCETYIGRDSRIPVVRLKPKGVNRACPLLVGDRCSVHSLKPYICRIFPLGRVMASESAPKDIGLGRPNEIEYIFNPVTCASLKRKQTVRDWLERFGILIEDDFFIKWNQTAFSLIAAIKKYDGQPNITPKTLDMMWSAIHMSLYIHYDTQKEFYPQFEANAERILGVFAKLECHEQN